MLRLTVFIIIPLVTPVPVISRYVLDCTEKKWHFTASSPMKLGQKVFELMEKEDDGSQSFLLETVKFAFAYRTCGITYISFPFTDEDENNLLKSLVS